MGFHLPAGHGEAEFAHGIQQRGSLLQEGGHLGTLVHRALDGQEAAIELIDQAHVHHVAEGDQIGDTKQTTASQTTLHTFKLYSWIGKPSRKEPTKHYEKHS